MHYVLLTNRVICYTAVKVGFCKKMVVIVTKFKSSSTFILIRTLTSNTHVYHFIVLDMA